MTPMLFVFALLLAQLFGMSAEAADCLPRTPALQLRADLSLATAAAVPVAHPDRARVERAVARILREEAGAGPWSSPDGLCLDLAALWQARLILEGIDARIATVDPGHRALGTPVERGMEGKFHAFVVIEAHGAEPLIVDGSWRQFIEGAEASPGLPEVFVGTLDELIGALARHQPALRIEIHDDPLLGQRDPRETAELAYGAGPWAELRELLPRP
jgi:hypothetical protein